MKLLILVALITCCLVSVGCTPKTDLSVDSTPGHVYQEKFGDKWPLTVGDGYVSCEGEATLFSNGGVTYSLNGLARTEAKTQGKDWKDIDEIWQPDPKIEGAKKDIGPLIDAAQDFCKDHP